MKFGQVPVCGLFPADRAVYTALEENKPGGWVLRCKACLDAEKSKVAWDTPHWPEKPVDKEAVFASMPYLNKVSIACTWPSFEQKVRWIKWFREHTGSTLIDSVTTYDKWINDILPKDELMAMIIQ
jgi:hypothetical protein